MRILLWKWSEAFDTKLKRQKAKLKISDITDQFNLTGDHPAIGETNIDLFIKELADTFGRGFRNRQLKIKRHQNCVVLFYSEKNRIDLLPKIAAIGEKHQLNAAEFMENFT